MSISRKFPLALRRALPFLSWWSLVTRANLRDDLLAGLTGALIVLPQGVAFATIAGLPPQYGLYAAMVPAIVAALFGSSWHLVSGPTTAISIALYAAIHNLAEPGTPEYVGLVLTLTLQVGIFQLALGLARMGAVVNFISHTVVIGFTSGAAVLIAASQIRSFFGIDIPRGVPFYEILHQFFVQLDRINPWVAGVGVATLVAGMLTKRYWKKFPYMIAAMLVGGGVAYLLNTLIGQAETGIKTVGALPAGLPPLSLPDFSFAALKKTFGPALVITMLALTEAVSIARAIAVRSEQRIDGNQEFIGQGLSNIVGAFFSGYASSGSFNRSGVNYEAGARTPLATMFASIFLVIILLVVAPLAAYLPNAAMAGILFLVAWGLIDFHHIAAIWRTSKSESVILWATIIGTLMNLEAGIVTGVLLSLLLYLNRTSRPSIEPLVPVTDASGYHFVDARGKPECPQLRIVRINGSAYFGAVDHIQNSLQQIDVDNPRQKSVLIVSLGMNFIDVAGAEMFAQEARRRRRLGGGLYFYRMKDTAYQLLRQGNYVHEIGEGAFFPVKTNPTDAVYWTLDPNVCRNCKSRIFANCNSGRLPDGDRRLRLMLAADTSEMAAITRGVAVALARELGVRLDIVAVGTDESVAARVTAVQDEAAAADVNCETTIRHGSDPADEIRSAALAANTQLLVIGRRLFPGATEIGPVAQRILTSAPCAVLVVAPSSRLWSRRVLVAFDGSDAARSATELAAQLAKPRQLPITLFSITDSSGQLPPDIEDAAQLSIAELKLDGLTGELLVGKGNIAEGILNAARDTGADLIVLYRHTRGGLSRKLLGSVGDEVIRGAEVPVLLVGETAQTGLDAAG
ncbi:MAG TPA: sulfate permease [Methylophilaceae bacterium]|nr:sulfate permease [Methylophilaceae bacterium]